jgi:hypothetical protein
MPLTTNHRKVGNDRVKEFLRLNKTIHCVIPQETDGEEGGRSISGL